jgi:hypothetical protein
MMAAASIPFIFFLWLPHPFVSYSSYDGNPIHPAFYCGRFLMSMIKRVAGRDTGASKTQRKINACSLPDEDESDTKSRTSIYIPVTMAIP